MKKRNLQYAIFLIIVGLLLLDSSIVCALYSVDKSVSDNDNDIVIYIKSDVVVSGESILMGDIAKVTSGNVDANIAIGNIRLGRSPWPGHKRNFGLGDIKTLLYNRGVDLSHMRFEGANEVTVRLKSITISGDEIVSHAKGYLLNRLNSGNVQIEAIAQQIPNDQVVPFGSGDIKLRFSRASIGKSKRQVYLTINILVDGNIHQTIGITFNIKRFGNIVIANKMMKSGEVVHDGDIGLESVELTRLHGNVFNNKEDIIGKVLKRSLSSGQIITKNMVEEISVVKRGDNVVILIRAQALEVTARGVCQDDGAYGDLIRVVNVDTKKVLFCNVIDSGTVEIKS